MKELVLRRKEENVKQGIHPEYTLSTVRCACGSVQLALAGGGDFVRFLGRDDAFPDQPLGIDVAGRRMLGLQHKGCLSVLLRKSLEKNVPIPRTGRDFPDNNLSAGHSCRQGP